MFYSPPLTTHFAEKNFIFVREFVLRLPQFKLFFPRITYDTVPWIDMKRGSTQVVPPCHVFPQNRCVSPKQQKSK